MQLPLQITLRDIGNSEALETAIREKFAKLEQMHGDIIVSCRIAAEVKGRHKHQGNEFCVHLDLKVPGGEIAINHDHHEDMHIALRDAFNAAKRKLDDFARVRRGETKHHKNEKRSVESDAERE